MGPSPLRVASRLCLWLALGLLALGPGCGCSVADGPELLQVTSVSPGLVEAGGALVVTGRGFPAGRIGQVELSGVSLVPGRDPERVNASLRGRAASSARLVVELGQPEIEMLTSAAPHATFHGRLALAFEPVRPGAPALRGHLGDVTLDALAQGRAPGPTGDFAAFLGIQLGLDLSVVAITPGLGGEAAGLRIGDRLHRLDGVRLLTLADFSPRQHAGASLLEYSRPGHAGRGEVLLARAAYFRTDEATLGLAASVGLGALLGLLLAARPPRSTVWLLQTKRRLAPRVTSSGVPRAQWFGLVALGALGALGLIGLLRGPSQRLPLDLPLLGGACLGALLLAALVLDGRRSKGGFSLTTAFWGASLSAVGLLPATVTWALTSVEVGSLSLREIAASQEAAPLGLGLLASPWALLGGICYLLALVPVAGERSPTGTEGLPRGPIVGSLEQFGLLLAVGLWVLIYGGGHGGASAPLGVALGVAFAKVVLLLGVVRWLRTVGGRLRRGESWEVWSWPVVVMSLLTAGTRLLWLRFEPSSLWAERLRWLPLACAVSVLVWLSVSALRSLSHHGRRADPWL